MDSSLNFGFSHTNYTMIRSFMIFHRICDFFHIILDFLSLLIFSEKNLWSRGTWLLFTVDLLGGGVFPLVTHTQLNCIEGGRIWFFFPCEAFFTLSALVKRREAFAGRWKLCQLSDCSSAVKGRPNLLGERMVGSAALAPGAS